MFITSINLVYYKFTDNTDKDRSTQVDLRYLHLIVTYKVQDEVLDFPLVLGLVHGEQITEHHHLYVAQDRHTGMPRLQPHHLQHSRILGMLTYIKLRVVLLILKPQEKVSKYVLSIMFTVLLKDKIEMLKIHNMDM